MIALQGRGATAFVQDIMRRNFLKLDVNEMPDSATPCNPWRLL